MRSDQEREAIKDYYSRVIHTSNDLATGACCCNETMVPLVRDAAALLHPEIAASAYGCASPIPDAIEGCTVLDLGCGTGFDTYICSRLVGPSGRVIGLDMTPAQLEVAQRHLSEQMERFGYTEPNIDFRQGFIEELDAAKIPDASIDVVISNCVINLSPDKQRVFSEIFRVLKPGGELCFSDVFADRRLPQALREDPILLGECLAGALYVEDLRRMMNTCGVADVRTIARSKTRIGNDTIEKRVRPARFISLTLRAFKLDSLEDRCEDFGQVAWYRGTIPGATYTYRLDNHHEFIKDKPLLVCGNTAAMLSETRLAPHFRVEGTRETHYGLFPCDSLATEPAQEERTSSSCC